MGKYDIGTIHKTNSCGDIEVVGYVDKNSRIIKFVRSGEEKKVNIQSIRLGGLADSLYYKKFKLKNKIPLKNRDKIGSNVGDVIKNKHEELITILEREGSKVKVAFLDCIEKTRWVTFSKDTLMELVSPNRKIVSGVGYYGDFKYKNYARSKEKSYKIWTGMIYRCYDEKTQLKAESYKNCKVCDDWHNYQNFKTWFDCTYIEGYELDKDLLQLNMKNKIYSPETCIWLPKEINSFLTNIQS